MRSRRSGRSKRAKHAVYENQRTIRAVEALRNNDVKLFGQLMNASHESLRYDYEVSCEEIDILVDLAQAMPGVIGSRITERIRWMYGQHR